MAVSMPIIAQKGTLPEDVLENGKNGYFIENAKFEKLKVDESLKHTKRLKRVNKERHNFEKQIKKLQDAHIEAVEIILSLGVVRARDRF